MTAPVRSAASLRPEQVELACRFGSLSLPHPIMTASGCFAYGDKFAPFFDLRRIAGLSTKGISPRPRPGNPLPRICETAAGMLNSIGLENVGAQAFLSEKLPWLAELGISVWVNFFGEDMDSYVECARMLDAGHDRGIDVLEMNISCPNIKKGGIEFGTVPAVAHELTKRCVQATRIPIVVKLSPNAADLPAMAQAVAEAGAVGVSLINTITGMAIDVRTRQPRLATTYGGLSGPAIKPIALRMIHQVHRAMPQLPICGMGGITTGEDALEFLMAGASCVQVGTANFAQPAIGPSIRDELRDLMAELGIARPADVIGCIRPVPPEPAWASEAPEPGSAS
ncbi:dihydroorotate dehydrogenase [Paraliomyxa miuraensis]|uniref:dihydroorotate dehydrogenase n=1 Tax=Paraliomyxa miuraensis TaxID=376150 RepID=UPI00225BCB9B|nr:dihydroorotate dehydrogenase [Paraliomyxa miuraensis]MCX4242376.1 dihydroorotate dehydrogenase [Paraliomyxa miuraensis]